MVFEQAARATPSASLTSNPEHFSEDAWELLLASQDTARRWRHGAMDVEHLLQTFLGDRRFGPWVQSLPIDTDRLLDRLEAFCVEQPPSTSRDLYIGDALEDLLEDADRRRAAWGSRLLDIPHLLVALLDEPRIGSALLQGEGLTEAALLQAVRRPSQPQSQPQPQTKTPAIEVATIPTPSSIPSPGAVRGPSLGPSRAPSREPEAEAFCLEAEPEQADALSTYGRDLTAAARAGELDPVVGRDQEIRLLIQVLSRRSKNNPVLIGEPGVGKTAVAELLAQRMVAGEVPDSLKGLRLVALDLGALVAGAKFRGQFEERLRGVLQEVREAETGVVLFIDELHTVVNSERSGADASSVLKPALARGDLRCIGATTPEDYRRTVEKDPALERRFQQVLIKEPGPDTSVEILRGLKERYELHHGVAITDQALVAAARLADRYITDRCLPDSAIDLVDQAAANLRMEATSKPQRIETAEADLRRVELALLSAEAAPEAERVQLQEQRRQATDALHQLQARWQVERDRLAELGSLLQQDEDLRHAIAEAEREGDLELAAQLQYDQLHGLQERRDALEAELRADEQSRESLLREQVEAGDIADVVARWTGIPVQRLLAGERQKLLELEARLAERVIGQPEAVAAVAAAIRRARAGMQSPRRPVGSFLFLGPTGVGKTELAKALAGSLFDEEDALVRLDMSEYMERNAVARLVGAPPGYVGYEEGGQLTEAVRRRPYAVVLLDEVEKAHPEVFNLLLQVLDDGRLTDSQGRTVDFRHTVVIMTSNLASRAILDKARATHGAPDGAPAVDEPDKALDHAIERALASHFRPEFLNRIDEVIRFRPLELADLQRIVRLQLAELSGLLAEQHLALEVDEAVVQSLVEQGYEPEYGARPLRRVVRRQIENPLATELLAEHFSGAKGVRVELAEPLRFVPVL